MAGSGKREIHILTVCTGNICRSPMAEGILRKILGSKYKIRVSSAGTHALEGNPPSEFAVLAAIENGIDISGHRARPLDEKLINDSNIILCMEPSHIEWVVSLDPSAYGSVYNLAEFSENKKLKKIPDPYGSSLREYRECFTNIHSCLNNFVSSYIRESGSSH